MGSDGSSICYINMLLGTGAVAKRRNGQPMVLSPSKLKNGAAITVSFFHSSLHFIHAPPLDHLVKSPGIAEKKTLSAGQLRLLFGVGLEDHIYGGEQLEHVGMLQRVEYLRTSLLIRNYPGIL